MKTKVNTFETIHDEWCAEVWVNDSLLEEAHRPSQIEALEALWRKVYRTYQVQNAGLTAVMHEVYRVDPLREWRAVGRRIAGFFSRLFKTTS